MGFHDAAGSPTNVLRLKHMERNLRWRADHPADRAYLRDYPGQH
jgi:hypothetical protein